MRLAGLYAGFAMLASCQEANDRGSITLVAEGPYFAPAGSSNAVSGEVVAYFHDGFRDHVTFRAESPGGIIVSLRDCREWLSSGFFDPPPQRKCSTAFTVANDVIAGSYPITFVAYAGDRPEQRTSSTLTVTPAVDTTHALGFVVSLTPSTVTLTVGDSIDVLISLARLSSFAGPVTLSLDNPIAGLSLAFRPSSILAATSSSAIARIKAVAALPFGSTLLLICGRATGWADDCRPLPVHVNP